MPCMSSTGMGSDGTDYEARRENERLTRVSCDIIRTLEAAGADLSRFSEETRRWWDQHKASDAAREQARLDMQRRDAIREAALAKLTPEERKALGV